MHRHTPDQARHAIARALWDGTSPAGLPAAQLIERGTLKLYFYAPRGEDRQPVHDQDEVYVVVKGHGTLFCDGDEILPERIAFGPGDVLFVPAGMPHCFEDFTDDFRNLGGHVWRGGWRAHRRPREGIAGVRVSRP